MLNTKYCSFTAQYSKFLKKPNMDSNINTIQSFSNEMLVKFIEKMGHHEAAKIVQEKNLDGQKILELKEMETLGWKLTSFQRNLLWNCISQIKSNPIRSVDIGNRKHPKKILNGEETRKNNKDGRPLVHLRKKYSKFETPSSNNLFTGNGNSDERVVNKPHKYFTFRQFKKKESVDVAKCISQESNQNIATNSLNFNESLDQFSGNKHVALKRLDKGEGSRDTFYYSCTSINEEVFDSARKNYYRESEYIYGPCLEGTKDNTTVDRIKKYLKRDPERHFSFDDNAELLKNSGDIYLELSNLPYNKNTPHSSKLITDTNIYDVPCPLPTNSEDSQLPKDQTKKKPGNFMITFCCLSCYAGCTVK